MKHIFILIFLVSTAWMITAQDEKWPDLDNSTMDLVYYPENVAWRNYLSEDQRNITPKLKLSYSRPMKNDRVIFGELIKYGNEWRMGANEATTLTCYVPVAIGDATLQPGNYTMSALVEKGFWTLNFSTESGIWGSANRDKSKTVASIKYTVEQVDEKREDMVMTFQEVDDQHANMIIEWDGHRVTAPIAFNPVLFNNIDPSPMDMAHYPRRSAFTNYAEGEDKNITPKIQVTYSRPQKKGRDIFGGLLKSGDIWRIGANEATEIAVYEDATINGTKVARGRYAMFAKLGDTSWDIIFSKDYPIWGAANRDESKDVVTISVPVTKETEVLEALSIKFEEKGDNLVHLQIGWDTTRAAIPFQF